MTLSEEGANGGGVGQLLAYSISSIAKSAAVAGMNFYRAGRERVRFYFVEMPTSKVEAVS